jgi:hypothetical protein
VPVAPGDLAILEDSGFVEEEASNRALMQQPQLR